MILLVGNNNPNFMHVASFTEQICSLVWTMIIIVLLVYIVLLMIVSAG